MSIVRSHALPILLLSFLGAFVAPSVSVAQSGPTAVFLALGDEVYQTGIAGASGSISSRLSDCDDCGVNLFRIREDGDEPCWAQANFHGLQAVEAGPRTQTFESRGARCSQPSSGGEIVVSAPASYLYKLEVCTNDRANAVRRHYVKGIRAWFREVLSDGQTRDVGGMDSDEQPNCRDNWNDHGAATCPAGQVASGVIVHTRNEGRSSRGKDVVVGVALECRTPGLEYITTGSTATTPRERSPNVRPSVGTGTGSDATSGGTPGRDTTGRPVGGLPAGKPGADTGGRTTTGPLRPAAGAAGGAGAGSGSGTTGQPSRDTGTLAADLTPPGGRGGARPGQPTGAQVTQTAVSGEEWPAANEVLGSWDGVLTRVEGGERSDDPCWIGITQRAFPAGSGPSSPQYAWGCSNAGTLQSVAAAGDEFITGIRVCTPNRSSQRQHYIKGIEVRLMRVTDGGTGFRTLRFQRPNCADWSPTWSNCPSGSVGSRLVVHYRTGTRNAATGLQLQCVGVTQE
jgi:hypothetical protein